MNDPILDIASLDEFEFKNLIINIFYFLDYDIDIIQNENNIKILGKILLFSKLFELSDMFFELFLIENQ